MMMTSTAAAGNQSQRFERFVQLGFSVEYEDDDHRRLVGHTQPWWQDWDGGQMGGRPSWLNPRDIPKHVLTCQVCQHPLVFICQLYAPCEEEEINVYGDAFHRSFYVFACPHSGKNSSSCGVATTGTVRVLRTQLPQQNEFYPQDPNDTTTTATTTLTTMETWTRHLPPTWGVKLCHVCGQRGRGKCPIQGLEFCCKQHQREHKKYVFDKMQQNTEEELSSKKTQHLSGFSFLPSVLAESELVVEEEPVDRKKEQASREKAEKALFQAQGLEGEGDTDKKSHVKSEEDTDENENDDEDEKLEQSDLNEMTGASAETVTNDAVTMQFYDRVNKLPNVNTQCLRYLRWPDHDLCRETNTPLWIRSDYQPKDDDKGIPPPCENCGADRKFEFQLMPQMLHYLLQDLRAERAKQTVKRDKTAVTDSDGDDDDDAKTMEAIKAVTDLIEQAPPEQVPPDLAATKEKAVENMRKKMMDGHTNDNEPGWGVVSIFTCTASCSSSYKTIATEDDCIQQEVQEGDANNGADTTALGAYIEEYAWRQPSLD